MLSCVLHFSNTCKKALVQLLIGTAPLEVLGYVYGEWNGDRDILGHVLTNAMIFGSEHVDFIIDNVILLMAHIVFYAKPPSWGYEQHQIGFGLTIPYVYLLTPNISFQITFLQS